MASTPSDGTSTAPHLEALAVLEDRLGLSEEQTAAVEPVLAQHHVEQQAVFERLRINPNASRSAPRPSRTELFELASALMPVWEQANVAMAEILDEAQMAEWMVYQNERRNQLRRRLQGRR
ncbi:hypothetical protein [Wenzhouxiangella marina]|nr:hypothetical protein [Wenzhouxiangella marina]MBB6086745.1 hypothetical protein [Wenzhouxiangella marina]